MEDRDLIINILVTVDLEKSQMFTSKMNLFGNRGSSVWDKQAMVNHRQVLSTRDRDLLLERKRSREGLFHAVLLGWAIAGKEKYFLMLGYVK